MGAPAPIGVGAFHFGRGEGEKTRPDDGLRPAVYAARTEMTDLSFQEDRLELFPTLVFRRQYAHLDAVNERLRTLILKERDTAPGIVRSNVGGFHTEADLLEKDDPAITVYKSLMHSLVHDYLAEVAGTEPSDIKFGLKTEAWANVQELGDYSRPHVHPSCHFSIVYYVDVGDEPEARAGEANLDLQGRLEVLDPRGRPNMVLIPGVTQTDNVVLKPKAGLMLIFPSWLYHLVHPYRGKRPRISIACNATVVSFARKVKGAS